MFDPKQQGIGNAGQHQLEEMVRLFSVQSFLPGMHSNSPFTQTSASWMPAFDHSLTQAPSLPALGIGREYHEDCNTLLELNLEYANAVKDYQNILHDFSRTVSEKFTSSIDELDEQADFDAVCRLWIDCCEKEFQKIAFTDSYAQAYGNMIDAFVRVLAQYKKMRGNYSTPLSEPSREELDEVHQNSLNAKSDITQLRHRITELEQEIKLLKTQKASRPVRSTARKTSKK